MAEHTETPALVLVLSGGMALGAYEGGALAALFTEGAAPPRWICGTSVGALNAAIAAGNEPHDVAERLRAFWFDSADPLFPGGLTTPSTSPFRTPLDEARRQASALGTLTLGRAGLFSPQLASALFGRGEPGLFSLDPLRRRLTDLIDFDRLNAGPTRLTITATDIESGEPVTFDTARGDRIGVEALMGCCAMLPIFAPVEVEGRLLGDGGLVANMPLAPVLDDAGDEPLACLLIDLMPLRGSRPETLAHGAARAADIAFASKTWSALAAAGREYKLRQALAQARDKGRRGEPAPGGPRPLRFCVLEYPLGSVEQGVAKLFDYSPASLERRWELGGDGLRAALPHLARAARGFEVERCGVGPDAPEPADIREG